MRFSHSLKDKLHNIRRKNCSQEEVFSLYDAPVFKVQDDVYFPRLSDTSENTSQELENPLWHNSEEFY